jgi:hypothetical protein
MGWKNVKEHYRIGLHLVHVTNEGICIGSGYCLNQMVISRTGELLKVDEREPAMRRYRSEMEADPMTLRRLIETPDQFRRSIPVFTFDGATIVEKQCEEFGWSTVTHDGELMTDARFSLDRKQAIVLARRAAEESIHGLTRAIDLMTEELAALSLRRTAREAILNELNASNPAIPTEDAHG